MKANYAQPIEYDFSDYLIGGMDYDEIIREIGVLPTEDELPCDDGEPMETERHLKQMNLLIESLDVYWKGLGRQYYVFGNMFLHYNPLDRRKFRGPDVFVVLDAELRERKSWVVWEEGKFPELIIELLSDTTHITDKTTKKNLYEQTFQTEEYYLYDPETQEFFGYHMTRGRYRKILPDKENKIFSPTTQLYLKINDNWLRWMTVDQYILPSNRELQELESERANHEMELRLLETQRANHEMERANHEMELRLLEKQRADRLTAKLKALGISID